MDQAQYWMWTRNKPVAAPERVPSVAHVNQEYSWEEQAFAEDSAGPHGGCIWPPRSYTCSFCRREFRSAQALGGHMNVHRRDRARLKQSPTSPTLPPENNIIHQIPFTSSFMGSTVIQQPSDQVCNSLIHSQLRINDPNLVAASSPNRVSAASSTQENCSSTKRETLVISPSYTSTIVHNETLFPNPFTRPEPIATARFLAAFPDSSKQLEQENDKRIRERESTAAGILSGLVHDRKLSSSAVTLDLVSYSPTRPTRSEEESLISNKRQKISNTSSTLPFFLKASLIDMDHLKPDGIGQGEDELDLELRLGA